MHKKSKENHTAATGVFRFADFDLSPSERLLRRRGKAVRMPPKVFDALLLFVRNAERLVRRDELIDALWPDTFVTDANLTNVIVTLRKILGRDALQTVSKFGYRFTLPVLGEPGIDEAIYARFLEAKKLTAVRSIDAMARARDLFSLCVANDPSFAAAWAWLGRCCRFLEKFRSGSALDLELAQAALERALAIDPQLACAHHFYTALQVDVGESRDAMVRLTRRLAECGDEPESYAGLVHALRFCGLLDESVAAHERAIALDPATLSSVHHTYFLRGEYAATIETYRTYVPTPFYLDAAAWAAMGETSRATALLRERLDAAHPSPMMHAALSSLLHILTGRGDEAMAIMGDADAGVAADPELLFYFARHCAMAGAAPECVRMIERARRRGFTASRALLSDGAFAPVRRRADFQREIDQARTAEQESLRAFQEARLRPDGRATARRRNARAIEVNRRAARR